MPDTELIISDEDYFDISYYLKDKHSIFSKFWEIGKPTFSEKIPTAAVMIDKETKAVSFVFNPCFWKYNDDYSKRFVICHEMLHLILNHAIRIKDAEKQNIPIINVCLDIVVNHLLVNKFEFNRDKINGFSKAFVDAAGNKYGITEDKVFNNYKDFCWVETVFDPQKYPERVVKTNGQIPSNRLSFENYYNLFPKNGQQSSPADGQSGCKSEGKGENEVGAGLPNTVDNHDGLNEITQEEIEKILKKFADNLSQEEKDDIEEMINDHFQEPNQKEGDGNSGNGGQKAGTMAGNVFMFSKIDPKMVKKKQKWETVIKKWVAKKMKFVSKEKEQWTRISRRMTMLPRDFFIPSEYEVEEKFLDKDKIEVYFFLDTSGSCVGHSDRFFKAAASLSEEKFKLRLFCFDTKVYQVDFVSKKLSGFGGTSFDCIENKIQEIMKKENVPYPQSVWILTDCFGTKVDPQHSDRWYIFMTENHCNPTYYFPRGCNFFELKEYE